MRVARDLRYRLALTICLDISDAFFVNNRGTKSVGTQANGLALPAGAGQLLH